MSAHVWGDPMNARWPDCATGWHERCPETRPGMSMSCGCPCHARAKAGGEIDPARRRAPAVAEVVAKVETLADELMAARYDSGTDHGAGYSDGLEEAADRLRTLIAEVTR